MASVKRGEKLEKGQKAYDVFQAKKTEILKLVAEGAIQREIAEFMGVSYRTFTYMIASHPEVEQELLRSASSRVREVKNALYRRAVGFTLRKMTSSEKGTTVIEEEVAPDVQAIRLYLMNYDKTFVDMTRETYGLRKKALDLKEESTY